ncbi:MAG: LptF/LptG family permease [Leptonema sp. (in: bacteria)]
MKLLDRYITGSVILSFFFSLIGLSLVFIFINLLELLKIESTQSKKILYLSLFYSIPQILVFVTPASIMFSVSYVISSMTYNREYMAIFSSGISFYRTLAGIFFFCILLSFFLIFFQNSIVVPYNRISQSYLKEYKKNLKKMSDPKDIIFQVNLKGQNHYYFINYLDPDKKMISGGFSILEFKMQENLEIPIVQIDAESARFIEGQKWILQKVREMRFDENLKITKVNFYLEKEIRLPESIDFFMNPYKNPNELNLLELKKEIEFRKKYSLEATPYEIYYHTMLSFPFFNIIIGILGAITGNMGSLRGGSPFLRSLLLSTVAIFLYHLLLRLGINLGESGILPPFIAGWGPLFLFLIVPLYLIYKHKK